MRYYPEKILAFISALRYLRLARSAEGGERGPQPITPSGLGFDDANSSESDTRSDEEETTETRTASNAGDRRGTSAAAKTSFRRLAALYDAGAAAEEIVRSARATRRTRCITKATS